MPFKGTRYSIAGFTMTDMDMGKLSSQDIPFLSQLGFPSSAAGAVEDPQEPMVHHVAEQTSLMR